MTETEASLFVGKSFRLLKDMFLEVSHGETAFVQTKGGPTRELRIGRPVFPHIIVSNRADPHGGYIEIKKGTILEMIPSTEEDSDDLGRGNVFLIHDSAMIVSSTMVINVVKKEDKWIEKVKAKSQWNLKKFNDVQERARELFKSENKDRKKKGIPLLQGEDLDLTLFVPRPSK